MAKRKPRAKWKAADQSEVAEFFGVSINTVQNWCAAKCPGVPGNYPLSEIAKWLRTTGPWRKNIKPEVIDDPLLTEGDSPGLERYRQAKASLAEIELEKMRGNVLPLETVRENLARWASLIRRMGETLGKRHGPEAARVVNETLEECGRIIAIEELTDDPGPAANPDDKYSQLGT